MTTIVLSSAGAALGPVGQIAGTIIGSVIDSLYVYPAIQGSKKDARAPRTFDLQTPTADPGDVRIIAFGSDGIRVPCHVLFLARDTESIPQGSRKTGRVFNTYVYGDLAAAVNDRKTRELRQLIADGKLVYFTTLNLTRLRSHRMTVVESSTNLVLTATTTLDEDFASYFEQHDTVKLANFTPNDNNGYWKVSSVAGHSGSTPSTMTLARRQGQNTANGTAGTSTSPGTIERVDDAIVEHDYTCSINGNPFGFLFIDRDTTGTSADFEAVFKIGDEVTLSGFTPSASNHTYRVTQFAGTTTRRMFLQVVVGSGSIAASTFTTVDSDINTGTDKITESAHGMANGQQLRVTESGPGFPTSTPQIAAGVTYFVVNATTNDFQISTTRGGSAINFTSAATGATLTWTQQPTPGTSTAAGVIRFTNPSGPAAGMFRPGTSDNLVFYDGEEPLEYGVTRWFVLRRTTSA